MFDQCYLLDYEVLGSNPTWGRTWLMTVWHSIAVHISQLTLVAQSNAHSAGDWGSQFHPCQVLKLALMEIDRGCVARKSVDR